MTASTTADVAPILFLVFNRPDTTARVFEAIRVARPGQLFVAADGPRDGRETDPERCEQARAIATAVDWPCVVTTLFRERNLGCKRAVSSAIDWFFEQVPQGLILEDDCVPDPTFFVYATELLARYRDDPRVVMVSGDNFISATWRPAASYYFSALTHIWGWGSWRRAWTHYDVEMADWVKQRDEGLLERVFPGAPGSQRYWTAIFDRVARGEIDTWDYQWLYATFKRDGVSCMPAVNLISNIGFGADATHTHNAEAKLANLPIAALPLPLIHPSDVAAERSADAWTAENVFGIGLTSPRSAKPAPSASRRGPFRRVLSRVKRTWRAAVR
ncbi:MAG: hypothetical protein QOE66_2154 [Chloroflexota bacterium]|jgi:hypothetical protein|nr:hypothetical protein [Chloroflexota bacterium]